MCGIFALLNNTRFTDNMINTQFEKGKNRGPEYSTLVKYLKAQLGFHRLAINGLNEKSNQPITIDDIVLICNGEIYNYKELYKEVNVAPETDSDCEIIIHLYKRYGIEQTLQMLDGVFSFVLLDNSLTDDLTNQMYVARDTYGVCPLYYFKDTKNVDKDNGNSNNGNSSNGKSYNGNSYGNQNITNIHGFASELKCLSDIFNILYETNSSVSLEQFKPSTYSVFHLSSKVNSLWELIVENKPYIIPGFSYSHSPHDIRDTYKNIAIYLTNAVEKRCLTTERPIACLLSGGLDSSLITALVNNYYKKNNFTTPLETFSIGLEGSEDIKYAKIVAEYLGTKHTEIIVTEDEMFSVIPEVIHKIESYDITSVRASIGNYLLGKYIAKHSKAKVIFNGDGSDELCGGYLYMNKCADNIEFDKETRRLLSDIHFFDVLRSDKSISSNGLEPRTPFLDRSFVNYYLSIPAHIRFHKNGGHPEKYLLRKSFEFYHFQFSEGKQLLPKEILWRKKEAFSNGVSSYSRSLFEILQDKIIEKISCDTNEVNFMTGMTKVDIEKLFYYSTFQKYFPNLERVLPYYWMPKYSNTNDPSARTLEIYEKQENQEKE